MAEATRTRMTLRRFKVTNFRSVEDSGWIETDNITALIGTNESGKTNILLALWKLRPAKEKEGTIITLDDYPRKRFNEFRNLATEMQPIFIEAEFDLSSELASEVSELAGATVSDIGTVRISRDFAGAYHFDFPKMHQQPHVEKDDILTVLTEAARDIVAMVPPKSEEQLREQMIAKLATLQETVNHDDHAVDAGSLNDLADQLGMISTDKATKNSLIRPRYAQVIDSLAQFQELLSALPPSGNPTVCDLLLANLPAFVYYSTYGNLDSEIYLPHVIANMMRTDLGIREEAKSRTLRVLFEFVGLSPEEIRDLGRELDPQQSGGQLTDQQIKETADRKRQREILLQSASSRLTDEFRNWWKQGDYRFRFQADGNHFRIWVSDDRRTEEIELEGRSAGLQWFLSFYLVFLVEQQDAHKGAIVLLDEPGHSLHPIGQQDLSVFFEDLARTNQLLYTTHSPFLVDSNHLDRVKVVYVNQRGATVVSANLRASEAKSAETRSIYPVHAALGLSVSQTLLLGSQIVIVEGMSDQIYLSAIKNVLIGRGLITPNRELVFVPGGSNKGITATVAVLAGKDEEMPHVLVDSDAPGQRLATQLKTGIYQHAANRIIRMGDLCPIVNAEVEDLIPPEFLAGVVDRYLRVAGAEEDFSDVLTVGEAIVPQIEAYAMAHDVELVLGWKAELATRAKDRLLRGQSSELSGGTLDLWTRLFKLLGTATPPSVES